MAVQNKEFKMRKRSTKKPAQQSQRIRSSNPTINGGFRRNTVVTSRAQREVAERQQSVTQRQLDKKRQIRRRVIKVRVLFFAATVIAGLFLYQSSLQSVQFASNASGKLQPPAQAEYERVILEIAQESTLGGQMWLLDDSAANERIKERFAEVDRVEFSGRPLSRKLKVEVRFRSPAFTWLNAAKERQYVDSNGVLFAKNLDAATKADSLVHVEDQSGVVLEEGTAVLTESIMQFIGRLPSGLQTAYSGEGGVVERVVIPKSTREIHVAVSGQPYFIKFSISRDFDEQVAEMRMLLEFLKSQNITPSNYIDLRVAHKAFYK